MAHKGTTAGAKVQAFTALDLLLKPELVKQAWDYFKTEQSKEATYQPLIGENDKPAIWLNEKLMKEFRPEMSKYYFNPASTRRISNSSGSRIRPRRL